MSQDSEACVHRSAQEPVPSRPLQAVLERQEQTAPQLSGAPEPQLLSAARPSLLSVARGLRLLPWCLRLQDFPASVSIQIS